MRYIPSLSGSESLRRSERGVAAVEFAIVLIPLLLIVAGIIECGKAFWYYDALAKATRDAARLMSMADKDAIVSAKSNAENLVVNSVNAARVSPALTTDNVNVECMNAVYASQVCTNGTAPAHVRVSIVNFSVDVGEWIPFISDTNIVRWNDIALSPSTTMRYLCTGAGSC